MKERGLRKPRQTATEGKMPRSNAKVAGARDGDTVRDEVRSEGTERWLAAAAEDLVLAGGPTLTEDQALSLLKRRDLPLELIEALARNLNVIQSRKVRLGLASHPRTPRHLSVPVARQLATFDLMKLTLTPGVPADVKVAVEDVLVSRLKAVTLGERLTLARRGSGRVAAALLLDGVENGRETRVMLAALGNARLTEALVTQAVLRPNASPALVQAVAHHSKWSLRRDLRAALLRTEHLSLGRALEFGQELPVSELGEILANSRLPDKVKTQLLRQAE
jgi:hypothetical protein